MSERIGFISTRFAGTDGVSLESAKWAKVFGEDGHQNFWYAGRLDRNPDCSFCVPEAFFEHPENSWINQHIWGKTERDPLVTRRILDMAEYLKESLYRFVERYDLTMLVAQNSLTIPMHVPLGIALTEYLHETHIPCIAHHHDFFWERIRFSVNAVGDYLDMAFPPRDEQLLHVVINAAAQEELSWRRGLPALLIPNVFDFDTPAPESDDFSKDARRELGFSDDDILILQPTRIVPRKGIEHAIKLVSELKDPRCKLVISHSAGDEGYEYQHILTQMAHEEGVELHLISDRISETRSINDHGEKIYTLWDLYPHVDFVTYPSIYEGFGNALLEALYFKLPVLINRYSIFARDIEPKGFRLPVMDGYMTKGLIEEVRHLLEDATYRKMTVEHNYALARNFYSYSTLRRNLRAMMAQITGKEQP